MVWLGMGVRSCLLILACLRGGGGDQRRVFAAGESALCLSST
eukprot:COSAG02_NODE_7249_length_3096_cov_5.109073_3_plen_41_part_01